MIVEWSNPIPGYPARRPLAENFEREHGCRNEIAAAASANSAGVSNAAIVSLGCPLPG
jgi:hypothetical protein